MNIKRYFLFFLLIVLSLSLNAQKKAFTIDDLYKIKNVITPVLSNSGERLVFSVTESDLPNAKTINLSLIHI